MPHVRMSKELLGIVERNAQHVYLKANPKPDSVTGLTSAIMAGLAAMPAYQKAMAFINDSDIQAIKGKGGLGKYIADFQDTSNCKSIVVAGFKAKTATPGVLKETSFTAHFPVPVTMRFIENCYQGSLSVNIGDIPEPHRTEISTAIQGSIDAEAQWQERYDDYKKRTSDIFNICKSTKQLIEAWPAAEKFLPPDVISKIFEKREETQEEKDARAKREAFTAGDLDAHILVAGMLSDVAPGEST